MAYKTHVLFAGGASDIHEDREFSGAFPDGGRWQVRMRTGRGGRSQGVQIVEIDNGQLCIEVVPTRGMGIWRVRRGDKALGWEAPAGEPVHPAFVPLMEPAGLGWLDGFTELLCRCGLESNGPPEFDERGRLLRPLHGRIANTPAKRVELLVDDEAGMLMLRGVVDESRFHFQSLRLTATISTSSGSSMFTWRDEVENTGGRDSTLQMLYHFNIGRPLLMPGSAIVAPVIAAAPHTEVAAQDGMEHWNIMPPPRPGSSEQVYLLELAADRDGETRVLVEQLADEEAISLRFNKQALPCFTVWRNTPADRDGYVLGIEPGTNFPNRRTFEQQHHRVIRLKPGERWDAQVTACWLVDPMSIDAERVAISMLQSQQQPGLSLQPRGDWSDSA